MNPTTELKPVSGWLKFFFKIPVYVHRLGFGGWEQLFGMKWMLLTTTGRKSGKPRRTMVDVVDYDRATDTYYIESGWGLQSDWYRNLLAHPVFEAAVGRRKFRAAATRLPPEEAGDRMVAFCRRNPAYARTVMKAVGITLGDEAGLREAARAWILLAVRPQKD